MPIISWRMKGKHVKNRNCAYGCPCDFNAPPTYGPCEGMAGMHIDEGAFGDVRLDGLRWACAYHWPGALHEGNGTVQAIIDERADEEQRTARVAVPGVFETTSEPIRNPVTGAPHRIRITMPEGFEYEEAEIASATLKGTGEIKFDHTSRHSSLAAVTFTESGLAEVIGN